MELWMVNVIRFLKVETFLSKILPLGRIYDMRRRERVQVKLSEGKRKTRTWHHMSPGISLCYAFVLESWNSSTRHTVAAFQECFMTWMPQQKPILSLYRCMLWMIPWNYFQLLKYLVVLFQCVQCLWRILQICFYNT